MNPRIRIIALSLAAAQTTNDYDDDNDNLIDIRNLAQLNAIRWDLNGDGVVSAGNQANYSGATGAFPNPATGMGCPSTCIGYELRADLNFDTDNDGSTHTNGVGDSGDSYYASGAGWAPIGPSGVRTGGVTSTNYFHARFNGNGHVISNLFVNEGNVSKTGMFAGLAFNGTVVAVGLRNAYVRNTGNTAGAIVGHNAGDLVGSWASGSVTSSDDVGGLVGYVQQSSHIKHSYSSATVACTGTSNMRLAGGLAGRNAGNITSSYSTGAVSGANCDRYGLSTKKQAATGTATTSYWDTTTSTIAASTAANVLGLGYATADLQLTGYTGIYSTWNTAVPLIPNDRWCFASGQHPRLRAFSLALQPGGGTAVPCANAVVPDTPGMSGGGTGGTGMGGTGTGGTGGTALPPPNLPPHPVGEIVEGGEASMAVGAQLQPMLRNRFFDPASGGIPGDPWYHLRYEAESSDPTIATVEVLGEGDDQFLHIEALKDGLAVISVRATDREYASGETSFRVLVGQVLSFADVVAEAPEGGTLRLRLSLTQQNPDGAVPFAWQAAAATEDSEGSADANDLSAMSGTGEFAAGATEAVIEVAVFDDSDIETARERLQVELLENPNHYALGDAEAELVVLEGVCDRSPQVRDALRTNRQSQMRACHAVTDAELAERGYLPLHGRGIRMLQPKDFMGLSDLRILYLQRNGIRSLPDGLLDDLDALEHLDLADNRLDSLNAAAIAGKPNLKVLDLGGNQLRTIPDGLFNGVSALKELDLADNPGAPFRLTVSPMLADDGTLRAQVAKGTPFAIPATLRTRDASGRTYGRPGNADIPAGALAGESVSTDSFALPWTASVQLGEVEALGGEDCGDVMSVEGATACFRGVTVAAGEPLESN